MLCFMKFGFDCYSFVRERKNGRERENVREKDR